MSLCRSITDAVASRFIAELIPAAEGLRLGDKPRAEVFANQRPCQYTKEQRDQREPIEGRRGNRQLFMLV